MISEHGATVLPFRGALLRSPKHDSTGRSDEERSAHELDLPDNVILLARFSRRAGRAHRRHWLGGPPDGEAA